MSFILDALKKSEIERQESSAAEFAALPTNPGTRAFPRWLLVVGLLLAINLVVLLGLLLRQDSESARSASAPVTIPDPTPATTARSLPVQPSFEEQVAAARQNRPARQAENAVADEAANPPALQADLISQDPSTVTPQQLYPSLQEMRASGTLDLPDLHLDIHVYSETPADRFVFINMAKHREGSRLDEGPTLVEITPDGVVLRYQGKSFLVPRE
tara:strand:- start:24018 stop:24662 length:645 start_codon:yes stop_codon:yes gene_type:complete